MLFGPLQHRNSVFFCNIAAVWKCVLVTMSLWDDIAMAMLQMLWWKTFELLIQCCGSCIIEVLWEPYCDNIQEMRNGAVGNCEAWGVWILLCDDQRQCPALRPGKHARKCMVE